MILKQDQILELHHSIDTPALIIDQQQLEKNIDNMQKMANENGVKLRPHIKTHKSVYITKMLIEHGASGITVAKLGEAEVMAEAGVSDIFIANQITHPLKLKRLKDLNNKITLSIGIDHKDQIQLLREILSESKNQLRVLIELDSGLHRCGIKVGHELIKLAKEINRTPELKLEGIFTHAGHVYGAESKTAIKKIGEQEGLVISQAEYLLNESGFEVNVISVGSTPTVAYSSKNPSVTEIRPGNYVFYDNIQYVLNSCDEKCWALAVLATVISQPEPNRVVIDAGSKALNLDRGAHATQVIKGYGNILNIPGEIVRLSEEHGVIQLQADQMIPPGSPVLIIPNHACAVANLYANYHLIDATGRINMIPVDARGKSQ
jgi:D-serine deaminase-like pyridoxal phosphate-dependent protein